MSQNGTQSSDSTEPNSSSAESTGWPACELESVSWQAPEDSHTSRRQKLKARGPYQACVPAFIAGVNPALPSDLIAELEDAATAIARFDLEVGNFVAPFDAILMRSESASSSEVENLTASAKQLALASIGEKNSRNAQIVVDNVSAMRAALDLGDAPTGGAIIEMHRALLGRSRPEICGSWRSRAVWIGGQSPHTADFVGPESGRIDDLIADLELFMRRTDLLVLAQVALAHAQFETIHPFVDGNGRTGRALVQSLLRHTGLAENTAIPISAGLLHDTQRYFSALSAYRRGEIVPIIRAFSEAAFRAISNGRLLVKNLQQITDGWAAAHKFRANSAPSRILGILLDQPVVSVALLRDRLGLSATALIAGISRLVEAGVLTSLNGNKRNRIWLAEEVLIALDAFAARARRR